MKPLEEKLMRQVCTELRLERDQVTRASKFSEICDSLDVVEMTLEIEDDYEINIPDGWGEHVNHTVGEYVDQVLKLIEAKEKAS